MELILTHLGSNPPEYIKYCIEQFQLFNPKIKITLIYNEISNLMKYWCDANNVNRAATHHEIRNWNPIMEKEFEKYSIFKDAPQPNTNFPSPPNWLSNTARRLFVLCDYMRENKIENVIHIENDVACYTNFCKYENEYNSLDKTAITRATKDHISCAFMYIPNYKALMKLCVYFLEEMSKERKVLTNEYLGVSLCEMTLLSRCPYIHILPSLPTDSGILKFGLYDPCSMGQYLFGLNSGKDTIGHAESRHFIGSAIINNKIKINFNNGYPELYDVESEIYHKINTLHIHSKKLKEARTGG